jgi:type VI secretion system secreted protein Hcp
MPGNAFIKFSGDVKGESLQEGHAGDQGWIEIGDWNWDIEAETSFTKGTGAAVGKPTPGTLSFSHYYDKSSPVIMNNILMGTHFKTARIDMLKQTGQTDGKPQAYFQLNMKDVFITKVSSKGGEDGTVNQDVDMVFKACSIGYRMQKNDGTLDKTVLFGWDISQMNFNVDPSIKVELS